MNIEEVSARIIDSNGTAPVGTQRELLDELTQLYGSLGVLGDGVVPALRRVCPAADACWKGIEELEPPTDHNIDPRSEKGCIFLPWVGPRYERGGVCVVGLNLRYAGKDWEYTVEHRIARHPQYGQFIRLGTGKRAHRSNWARFTMRDVVAVQRSLRGESPLGPDDHQAQVAALLSSARVQAVKCSPTSPRSTPTRAMATRCPPRYLARELRILRPSALLVYGAMARGAVASMLEEFTYEENTARFRRGYGKLTGAQCEVFFVTHPAHGGWHPAHRELIASLGRRGVAGAEDASEVVG